MSKISRRMIRVNHAGEYGALRLYQGQKKILGEDDPALNHMEAQEKEHFAFFQKKLFDEEMSPTLFHPLWHVGAFTLGAVSAMIGPQAAHACTVAVETVIDEHYEHQIEELRHVPEEKNLRETISQFQKEEREHRDLAMAEGGGNAYPVLSKIVRGITRGAIFLSSRW